MNKSKFLQIINLLLVICGMIAISLCAHFSSRVDSMLNDSNHQISDVYLQEVVDYHKTEQTFRCRPFTTWAVEKTSEITNVSIGTSFIFVNYFFFALSGIVLYFLSKSLGSKTNYALINVVVFYLCFSNIFAFFVPVYSYDDPLQYLCVFAALYFYFKEQMLAYILFFTIALISRETTILLLPGLILFFQFKKGSTFKTIFQPKSLLKLFLLVIPVILYVSFSHYYAMIMGVGVGIEDTMLIRFTLFDINFETPANGIENFISIYAVCGFALYFTYCTLKNSKSTVQNYNFLQAFLLTFLLNTLVVIFFAKVREARLLAIPLFFIWPLFTTLFKQELMKFLEWKSYITLFTNWKMLSFFILSVFFTNIFLIKIYKRTIYSSGDFFNGYILITTALILLHFFLSYASNKTSQKPQLIE